MGSTDGEQKPLSTELGRICRVGGSCGAAGLVRPTHLDGSELILCVGVHVGVEKTDFYSKHVGPFELARAIGDALRGSGMAGEGDVAREATSAVGQRGRRTAARRCTAAYVRRRDDGVT